MLYNGGSQTFMEIYFLSKSVKERTYGNDTVYRIVPLQGMLQLGNSESVIAMKPEVEPV